jgi:hypothetical protein
VGEVGAKGPLLANGCLEPSFALLRSGRRMRISPNSTIKNEVTANIKDSSLKRIIDRITKISPIVDALLLEIGIPP